MHGPGTPKERAHASNVCTRSGWCREVADALSSPTTHSPPGRTGSYNLDPDIKFFATPPHHGSLCNVRTILGMILHCTHEVRVAAATGVPAGAPWRRAARRPVRSPRPPVPSAPASPRLPHSFLFPSSSSSTTQPTSATSFLTASTTRTAPCASPSVSASTPAGGLAWPPGSASWSWERGP